MTSRYGWTIDVDHIRDESSPEGTYANAKGVMGPRDVRSDIEQELHAGSGRKFRMYDDDHELYYEGRIITDEPAGSEDDFGPLDDFGRGNAGCTEIAYWDSGWKAL